MELRKIEALEPIVAPEPLPNSNSDSNFNFNSSSNSSSNSEEKPIARILYRKVDKDRQYKVKVR